MSEGKELLIRKKLLELKEIIADCPVEKLTVCFKEDGDIIYYSNIDIETGKYPLDGWIRKGEEV